MYRIAHSTPASIVGALVLLAGTWIPVGAANAATRVVGNCNDSGVGSLRAVVAAAATGDVIDLRSLGCSRIVLTSGSIAVPQASLTILGRTRYGLTIDGNRNDRVFLHTGTGTLRIDHVSVANGQRVVIPDVSGSEYGGCIYSDGNVALHQAWVHSCRALQSGFLDSPLTFGGGISAEGDVTLTWSAVFDNQALEDGTGGGIYAKGRVWLHHSQVYQNRGYVGGGITAERGASVAYSRIYRNRAAVGAAGLYVRSHEVPSDLLINKSTLSNNVLEDLWRGTFSGGGAGSASVAHTPGAGARSSTARSRTTARTTTAPDTRTAPSTCTTAPSPTTRKSGFPGRRGATLTRPARHVVHCGRTCCTWKAPSSRATAASRVRSGTASTRAPAWWWAKTT